MNHGRVVLENSNLRSYSPVHRMDKKYKVGMSYTATIYSSTINLVKTIVGAGLLAIPYVFKSDGIFLAILLTLLAAGTSSFGLFILSKCSKSLADPRNSSFFALCSITYPSLSLLFDFAMFIQCFGVGLSYLILVGDLFPGLFGGERNIWILASSIIIIPLSMFRKFDNLKYSSIIGLFSITYLSAMVIGTYLYVCLLDGSYVDSRGEVNWFHIYDFQDMVTTFSIIIFAYTGSMNIFSIINELENNRMKDITKVIKNSIIISTVIFISVSLVGYLTFGNNVQGNIILNYDNNSLFTKIGKFSLGSMVIFSFPLLFHPCRISANNMVYWIEINYKTYKQYNQSNSDCSNSSLRPISMIVDDETDRLALGLHQDFYQSLPRDDDELDQQQNNETVMLVPFSDTRFYLITIILLISVYMLALNIESFVLILALVGATGSTAISFILPGLFGYKLIGLDSLVSGKQITKYDLFYKKASLWLSCYGIVIMVIAVYVAIYYKA